VVQRQGHLDQPGHPGGALGVAQVPLHRADRQRPARPDPRAGRRARCLDPVAERVPVPCASRKSTSDGSTPARRQAAAITSRCDQRFGAVIPLLRPSWFTAVPRSTA